MSDKILYAIVAFLVVSVGGYMTIRGNALAEQRRKYDVCLRAGGSVDQCIHLFYPKEEAELNQMRQLLNKNN